MKNYKIEGTIGQGAHGLVLRGRHIDTGEVVALKKVLLKRIEDGIPVTIFREIKALQEVDCENVVQLLDVFPQGLSFVLVFEFMPSGLQEMMRDFENCLTEGQIKTYMTMLLKGVTYLHKHRIMHRGETDIEQLAIVIHTLGTPNEEVWPGVSTLPDYNKVSFKESRGIPLEQVFLEVSPEGVDLLKKLLLYDASKRISAEKALVHHYFFTRPLPCPMSEMPKPIDGHRQKISSKEYDVDRDVRTFFDDLRDILQQK